MVASNGLPPSFAITCLCASFLSLLNPNLSSLSPSLTPISMAPLPAALPSILHTPFAPALVQDDDKHRGLSEAVQRVLLETRQRKQAAKQVRPQHLPRVSSFCLVPHVDS